MSITLNRLTHPSGVIPHALWLLDLPVEPRALTMLLAIGLQESRLVHRRQIGGPARGLWQFERGGGVRGVLTHPASRDRAATLCIAQNVSPSMDNVYHALEHDDVLAAGFARLLLWTDPRPLPAVDDAEGAWAYYLRNWRPGKPHRHTWDALHLQAASHVMDLPLPADSWKQP